MIRIWRRHDLVGILAGDPTDQFTFRAFAGDDDWFFFSDAKCAFFGVEAEFGFARFFVWSMALVAVLRKNGAHLAVEIDLCLAFSGIGRQTGKASEQTQGSDNENRT